jgi:uncharacterized protein (DUF983 family)
MTRNLYDSGPRSDHFDGERFFAPGGAPDYPTMLFVADVIVAAIVAADDISPDGDMFVIGCAWSRLAAASSLFIPPRVKSALVGYQRAMGMHGFGGRKD